MAAVEGIQVTVIFLRSTGSPPIEADAEYRLQLRALRASPPGAASRGERKKVFCSALEQSEQLLEAAAAVPAVVRPLLLFYGLSQGVRAVLAADSARDNNSYVASGGHGVRTQNLSDELKNVELKPHASGMLPQLCESMEVDMYTDAFTLGEMWAANPDLFQLRLATLNTEPAVGSLTCAPNPHQPGKTLVNIGLQPEINVQQLNSRTQVAEYVNETFVLPVSVEPLPEASLFKSSRMDGTFVTLTAHADAPHADVKRALEERVCTIGYNTWICPRIGGITPRPNSLVSWWCLLEALSARARYSPQRWTHDIDPDSNVVAVQLETLLAEAGPRCYRLILDAVRAVSR